MTLKQLLIQIIEAFDIDVPEGSSDEEKALYAWKELHDVRVMMDGFYSRREN